MALRAGLMVQAERALEVMVAPSVEARQVRAEQSPALASGARPAEASAGRCPNADRRLASIVEGWEERRPVRQVSQPTEGPRVEVGSQREAWASAAPRADVAAFGRAGVPELREVRAASSREEQRVQAVRARWAAPAARRAIRVAQPRAAHRAQAV